MLSNNEKDNRSIEEVQKSVDVLKNQKMQLLKTLEEQEAAFQSSIKDKEKKIEELSKKIISALNEVAEISKQEVDLQNQKMELTHKRNELRNRENILTHKKNRITELKKTLDTMQVNQTAEIKKINELIEKQKAFLKETQQHIDILFTEPANQISINRENSNNEESESKRNSSLNNVNPSIETKPTLSAKTDQPTLFTRLKNRRNLYTALFVTIGIVGVILNIFVWPVVPLTVGGWLLGSLVVANKTALIAVGTSALAASYALFVSAGGLIKRFFSRKNHKTLSNEQQSKQPSAEKIEQPSDKPQENQANELKKATVMDSKDIAQHENDHKSQLQQLREAIVKKQQTNKQALVAAAQKGDSKEILDRLNQEIAHLEKILRHLDILEKELNMRESISKTIDGNICDLQAEIKKEESTPTVDEHLHKDKNDIDSKLKALDEQKLKLKQLPCRLPEAEKATENKEELKNEIVQTSKNFEQDILKIKQELSQLQKLIASEESILNSKKQSQTYSFTSRIGELTNQSNDNNNVKSIEPDSKNVLKNSS